MIFTIWVFDRSRIGGAGWVVVGGVDIERGGTLERAQEIAIEYHERDTLKRHVKITNSEGESWSFRNGMWMKSSL